MQPFNWTRAIEGSVVSGLLSALVTLQSFLNNPSGGDNFIKIAMVGLAVSFITGAIKGFNNSASGLTDIQHDLLSQVAQDIEAINQRLEKGTNDNANQAGTTKASS